METLSKGFKKPQTPDSGAEWFPALEDNIEQLNDHDHDGDNTGKLSSVKACAITTQDLLAASWVDQGDGTYRQLVTLPTVITAAVPTGAALTFDDLSLEFRLSSGEVFHPTVEKVSSTTFYAYINDSSKAVRIIYST